MSQSAFSFSAMPRGAPCASAGLIAADAAVLRGMSLELAQVWRTVWDLVDALHRIAGLPCPPQLPQQQLFPLRAEMAAPHLRGAILAELRDQVDLLASAVETFGDSSCLSAHDRHMVLAMLDHAMAARARMLAEVGRAGGAAR